MSFAKTNLGANDQELSRVLHFRLKLFFVCKRLKLIK